MTPQGIKRQASALCTIDLSYIQLRYTYAAVETYYKAGRRRTHSEENEGLNDTHYCYAKRKFSLYLASILPQLDSLLSFLDSLLDIILELPPRKQWSAGFPCVM